MCPRPSSSSRKRRGEEQPEDEDELEEVVEEAAEEEPEESAGEEAEEEGEIHLNNPHDDFWKREGALVIRQHASSSEEPCSLLKKPKDVLWKSST